MSLTIMLSGSIAKQPETRTSKNGNEFATTTVRTQTAEGDLFASVTAFSELAPILARLQRGDPVTVIGTGKVSTYQGRDGDTKAGLSVVASRIIALADHQAPPKPKATKSQGNGKASGQQQYSRSAEFQGAGPREFNDDLPDFQ